MKRKIISLILATGLVFSVSSSVVFANNSGSIAVQVVSNEEPYDTNKYATLTEAIAKAPQVPSTFTLLTDCAYTGTIDLADQRTNCTFDLNGHTLTINASDGSGIGINHGTIKNGTIVFKGTGNSPAIYVLGYFAGGQETVSLQNIKIVAEQTLTSVIFMSSSESTDTAILDGCIIDADSNSLFNATGGTISIKSGSYKGLDADTLPAGVMLASGSTSTNVDGVANGTTVIISSKTAAIVVKDGMAYTYDDVEDAKAAQADGKLLVKNEQGVFAEEAKKVTWVTATDSGVYTADQAEADRKGMVRFLFNADIAETDIKESGIKCVSGDNITEAPEGSLLIGNSGTARVFYADITEIPTDNSGTFYAIAYVTDKNNNTYWSQPVSAAVDTSRVFTSID